MRRGWVQVGVLVGLAVCGGAAWWAVRYVVGARDQGTAGSVAQGLAAVLVPLAGLVVWLVRQGQRGSADFDLQQAAEDLAGRVQRQWDQAARQRGLFDRRLNVRWVWSPRGLSGPTRDALGDPRTPRFAALPGVSRTELRQLEGGELHDLFALYGGLDSGRMVLVGAPGAGKSAAMILLLLDALAHRVGIGDAQMRGTVPVPVLLTAYDWRPEHEELAAWVARRLEAEHSTSPPGPAHGPRRVLWWMLGRSVY